MEGNEPDLRRSAGDDTAAREVTNERPVTSFQPTAYDISKPEQQVQQSPKKKFSFKLPNVRVGAVRQGGKSGLRVLVKFWYVIVVIVVIVAIIVFWQAQKAAETNKWNKVSDYYGRADYAAAAKLLDGDKLPDDENRLRMYAQSMLATRQLDKALPAYNKLYEKKKDISVKIIIGNIYNEQKKYAEAEKVYKDVIAANKTNAQTYVNLATLYKLQNKSDEAVSVAKQGVEANPGSVVLHELLVSMLLEDKQNPDFKKAVDSLRKLNPQDPLLEAIKQN